MGSKKTDYVMGFIRLTGLRETDLTTKMTNKTIGIVLLIAGIAMLIWGGFTYTRKEKVVDAGPIQISADRTHTISWPPYAGGVLVLGGIILLVTSRKR